jgi:hypothetical protein
MYNLERSASMPALATRAAEAMRAAKAVSALCPCSIADKTASSTFALASGNSVITGVFEGPTTHGQHRVPGPSSIHLPAQRATDSSTVTTSRHTGQKNEQLVQISRHANRLRASRYRDQPPYLVQTSRNSKRNASFDENADA